MIYALLTPLAFLTPLELSPEYSVEPTLEQVGSVSLACISIPDWIVVSDFVANVPDCDKLVSAAVQSCSDVRSTCAGGDYGAERFFDLEERYVALEKKSEAEVALWRYISIGAVALSAGTLVYAFVSR